MGGETMEEEKYGGNGMEGDDYDEGGDVLIRTHLELESNWKEEYYHRKDHKNGNVVDSFSYNGQYAKVYGARLEGLRDACLKTVNSDSNRNNNNDDDNNEVVSRIIEVKEGLRSTVVGTLVKEMPNRPTVDTTPMSSSLVALSYLGQPYTDDDKNNDDSWVSDKDTAVLEDGSGRLELDFASCEEPDVLSTLASGMVLAMTGVVQMGVMTVQMVHWPESTAPPPTTTPSSPSMAEEYILLLSGLECGSSSAVHAEVSREMLLDYLAGYADSSLGDIPKIGHIVLAGGACAPPQDKASSMLPLQELDSFLSPICHDLAIPLDYIPGPNDPTNANWPQNPLHSSLFPQTSTSPRFHRTTNPYCATTKTTNIRLVGSDGANIRDLKHYLKDDFTDLQALHISWKSGHLCPTAPDSLTLEPTQNQDSFLLKSPHVYFAGNSYKFDTTVTSHGTRLIAIPSFAQTGQVVLLSTQTLQCHTLTFQPPQNNNNNNPHP